MSVKASISQTAGRVEFTPTLNHIYLKASTANNSTQCSTVFNANAWCSVYSLLQKAKGTAAEVRLVETKAFPLSRVFPPFVSWVTACSTLLSLTSIWGFTGSSNINILSGDETEHSDLKLERWRGRAGTLGISTVVVVFKLESTVSDNRFWIEMYNKWKNIHVSIDQWAPSQSCIHRDQGHPRLVKRYESAVCYKTAFNWLSVTSLLLRWQQDNDIINWVHNFLHYDPSVVVDLNRNPLSGILMACHSGSLLIFRAVRSRGEEKLWSCTLS